MDQGAWVGLAIMVLWFGSTYLRVRRERSSGVTQSYGHPTLDSLLLLGSALVLIMVLGLLVSRFGNHRPGPHYLEDIVLLCIGLTLTWVCNRVLRRSVKEGAAETRERHRHR